jgi:hypothetical protein
MRYIQRGHIDIGITYLMIAILLGIGLTAKWSAFSTWVKIGGCVLIGVMIMLWIANLGAPSGMADNAARQGLLDDSDKTSQEDEASKES